MGLGKSLSVWWGIYKTASSVRRRGWAGVHLRGGDQGRYRYAYTVGFDETLDHPEIIVFDLPPREAFKILAGLFRNIRGGFRFEDGDAWATSRGDAVFRQVHPTRIYDELWLFFASYRRLVKTECDFGLEALQLVLPDTEARLPSEAGYDEALRSCQPELYTASNAEVAASARL